MAGGRSATGSGDSALGDSALGDSGDSGLAGAFPAFFADTGASPLPRLGSAFPTSVEPTHFSVSAQVTPQEGLMYHAGSCPPSSRFALASLELTPCSSFTGLPGDELKRLLFSGTLTFSVGGIYHAGYSSGSGHGFGSISIGSAGGAADTTSAH